MWFLHPVLGTIVLVYAGTLIYRILRGDIAKNGIYIAENYKNTRNYLFDINLVIRI